MELQGDLGAPYCEQSTHLVESRKCLRWKISDTHLLVNSAYPSKVFQLFSGCCQIELKIKAIHRFDDGAISYIMGSEFSEIATLPSFGRDLSKHMSEFHRALKVTKTRYSRDDDGNETNISIEENDCPLMDHVIVNFREVNGNRVTFSKMTGNCLEYNFEIKLLLSDNEHDDVPEPSKGPFLDTKSLLQSGDFSDFTIESNGNIFKVHKVFLAMRSPVFKAMLRNDMREGNHNLLKLDHISPNLVGMFINYIYTDEIQMSGPNAFETAKQLLDLAHQYDIPSLKSVCERKLIDNIAADTLAATLKIANTYDSDILKDRVSSYISHNKAAILTYPDFIDDLLPSSPRSEKDLVAHLFKCMYNRS